jgi:hypothetical protein
MKHIVAVVLFLLLWPAAAHAQCTAPGCEEATAVVSAARATARAVLTREAPTPAATWTPVPPTSTPIPPTATETATPEPTNTPRPTETPVVVVLIATAPVRAIESATVPVTSLADTLVKIGLFIFASVVMLASAGALMRMAAKWHSKQ